MLWLRIFIVLLSIIVMLGAGVGLLPMLENWDAQRQVAAIGNLITDVASAATSPSALEGGFASGGGTLELSSGRQVEMSGVPLGGYVPATIKTFSYSVPLGLWIEPTGRTTFTEQSLPVTITISAQRQLGVTPGLVTALAALPSCQEFAIGFPAGATMPANAQKFSCATSEREDNVSE